MVEMKCKEAFVLSKIVFKLYYMFEEHKYVYVFSEQNTKSIHSISLFETKAYFDSFHKRRDALGQ